MRHAAPATRRNALHFDLAPFIRTAYADVTHLKIADWRQTLTDPLYRSAYSLMANTAITSVLGVLFWLAAARLYSRDVVGRDSALLAALMALAVISQLNLNNATIRFLPATRRHVVKLVAGIYLVTAFVSLITSAIFVAVVPHLSSQFRFLQHDAALTVTFALVVSMWAVFTLQDSVLTAVRHAPIVTVENAIFGLVKLLALPILIAVGAAHGIFVAWAIPLVPAVVVVNIYIFRVALPRHEHRSDAANATDGLDVAATRPLLVRFLTLDYFSVVLNFGVVRFLPLIVVGVLGSRANAYFYIAFTIITAVDMLVYNIGTSLTVEAAHSEDQLAELASRLARRLWWWFALGLFVLIAAAPLVLVPFGPAYAARGTTLLRLLALSSPFRAVIVMYAAAARVRGRAHVILATNAALALLLVATTVVFAQTLGLNGVGFAWLASHAVVAVSVLPSFRRLLHERTRAFSASTAEDVVESIAEPNT